MAAKRQNEPLSSFSHFLAFLFSIVGLVLLIVYSALYGSAWHIIGFTVFGISLVLLYLSSALYHFFCRTGKCKRVFRRIDHSMIYVLIAGTYTPVCLTVLRGALGWTLFGVIWALAILGVVWKSCGLQVKGWISALFYIFMGWLSLIATFPLLEELPLDGFFWLVLGGVLYTVGAIFFGVDTLVKGELRKRLWVTFHDVFHLFVIAGSLSHFWFMIHYVLYL